MKSILTAGIHVFLLSLHGAALAAEPPQPAPQTGKLVTRVYSIPPDLSNAEPREKLRNPFDNPAAYLPASGKSIALSDPSIASWPQGAGVVIDRQTHQMVVRNIESNLKQLERLIAQWNEDWQKRREPVIYYDEVTFAVTVRKEAGHVLEVVYVLPSTFVTTNLANDLKEQGIPFPKNGSVQWDAKTRQATIRNTSPNLDLVMSWVASLWEESKEKPPFQDKVPWPVLLEKGSVDQAMRDLAAKKLPASK